MYHEVSHIVCFETFSVKLKENHLLRKYKIFGGPDENLSSPTHRTQFMIVFHLQSLGAERHRYSFFSV